MDGPSALLLPIAIAAYSGWQQHKTCIGEKHEQPVVENFCSNLRRGIDDTCKAGLSLPVHNEIKLTVGKKIEYVKFDDFMKAVIARTYSACTKFWEINSDYGFEQYRQDINEHASVLNLLLAKLPPSQRHNYDHLKQSLAAQGATAHTSNADVEQTIVEICKETGSCNDKPQEPRSGTTVMVSEEAIDGLKAHINGQLDKRNQELQDYIDKKILELKLHNNPNAGSRTAKGDTPAYGLIAEVGFAPSDHRISQRTCQSMAAKVKKAMDGSNSLHIVAHADHRGEGNYNRALSVRRAESVADCLHSAINLPLNIHKEGHGAIWTQLGDMQVARRASVYVRTLPPDHPSEEEKITE